MGQYNIAVVGATGMVGATFLKVLEERQLPCANFYLYASEKSEGKKVIFNGAEHTILALTEKNILNKKIHIALFSAGATVSEMFAPIFAKNGAIVIDNSSKWRTYPDVPLVVPEVNGAMALNHKGIIANPNCSTIQAVVAIKPLYDKYGIKRIIYSTYQAVSGAGVAGYNDLKNGIDGISPQKFPYQIFGNVIPQIDVFSDDGYTKEEIKMIFETKKILNDTNLKVTATTVRVPVFHGHSESINIEFIKPSDKNGIFDALQNAPGIKVVDNLDKCEYPMPIHAEGSDLVFVGRIRTDKTVDSGCNIWVVADNIRKGAATNAVQIAEYLIEHGGINQ
ncbi:MAG: aspartate-semialdehyde dehydrogenase [Christensenellaceae bacterium]|nr:aspartate-semialdehyde dehydrogenase [Christensenellaceae bacterium]